MIEKLGINILIQRFLFVIILVHTLIHVLLMGIERYRIPIDPFIIIIAFYGLYQIFQYFKSRTLILPHKISEVSN